MEYNINDLSGYSLDDLYGYGRAYITHLAEAIKEADNTIMPLIHEHMEKVAAEIAKRM